MYTLVTDGACWPKNPGPGGGWAAIVVDETGATTEYIGQRSRTTSTNNMMELTAVIEGLKRIPSGKDVRIISDSRIALGWCKKFYGQFHVTAKKSKKLFHLMSFWRELHKEFQRFQGSKVQLQWVRGHTGDPLNERAHILADQAAHQAAETKGA